MKYLKTPTLSNLTKSNYGVPPKKENKLLQSLGHPHVSSFNYMESTGLLDAIKDIPPVYFELPSGDRVSIYFEDASISKPRIPIGTTGIKKPDVYPTECRQRHETYRGRMTVTLGWTVNGRKQESFDRDVGEIPIMVRSKLCNLHNMNPRQLVEQNEDADEWGGYFIIKGLQKLIRMLILTRRNYPICVKRGGWKQRGTFFSDMGVFMRCVAKDQTSQNNILHYLTNGTAKLMFSHRKNIYFVPICLLLRMLKDFSDIRIYNALIAGYESDTYYTGCCQSMLRLVHEEGLHSQADCKTFVAKMFRQKFFELPAWFSDEQVADYILLNCIMPHLTDFDDKFNMLVMMTQKLFVFAQGHCQPEGMDAVMMQELLLGGHLYLQIVKEKLHTWLYSVRMAFMKKLNKSNTNGIDLNDITTAVKYAGGIQQALDAFLATGNLSSHSGLGLMQEKGLAIIAENINRMRYMSHFRAIHRGAFFMEMRTTEARQLLPDAWGFVCPVHTPDGAPCGLLNHLTMDCQVTDVPDPTKLKNIPILLTELGMAPINSAIRLPLNEYYVTILDGKVLGHVPQKIAARFVDRLRLEKVRGDLIPPTTEIVLVPTKTVAGQFPGLFLFTGPARMMRPVTQLATGMIELIGTFEQVYLDISVTAEEVRHGITTHMEISKTSFLSNLAQLIPMPDCNQSPRNMYQCQMGKQTMGTPIHTWGTQADTKLYRLETPGSPLFRPVHHDNIGLDNHAMGTNAIVAVISYTGYDMEDAMIINKSSYERGLAHGCIYKTEVVDLKTMTSFFGRDPYLPQLVDHLDMDGLPLPGTRIQKNDPFYCYFDSDQNRFLLRKFKDSENAVIDSVRLCSDFSLSKPRRAIIVYRVARNPSIGDKFASRAGQKGICSQLWPSEDLPFTESGMVPDIVFNPHGFPSRMTIAMMIEVLAGKSAAVHGTVHDATPFRFTEEDTAIDYFGQLLEKAGFNYFGTEPMYSGIDGRELPAHIFFGVVHYQRLRHMVADKWQVRRTGPVDQVTRQPVHGRKRGGGIRFGEMERDALISHGASFLLQDRLFHCSDKSKQKICRNCGSLLGVMSVVTQMEKLQDIRDTCSFCGDKADICVIEIPYIFKYLVTELAAINISIKIKLNDI